MIRAFVFVLFVMVASAPAEDRDAVFEEQIKPVLKVSCTPCHDAQTRSSGLAVLSVADLLAGGARQGAAIAPGRPDESVMLKMIRGESTPRMPMGGQALSAATISQIAGWIKDMKPAAPASIAKKSWAFEKPVKTSAPEVNNGALVKNDIDRFVLQKLEAKGLSLSIEATSQVLLRRAFFDLIGLPPTPAEAKAFLEDAQPRAYERLIDRLLADPRYGERWARHWLDLARYADTQGFEADRENYHMWRYRDYVIDAFNGDKPYDRFVKEQIAGDEIAPESPEAKVALGFLRLTPRFQTTSVLESRQLTLDELTATVGSVFLGLTMKCAQCHDHKYDPIPQKDFYRLQAFFIPVELADAPAQFTDVELRARMETAHAEQAVQLKSAQQKFQEYQASLMARLGDMSKEPAAPPRGRAPIRDPKVAALERRIYQADANALTVNPKDSTFTTEEKQKYLDLLSMVDGTRGGRDMGLVPRRMARYEPVAHSVKNAALDSSRPSLPVAHVRIRGEYNQLGEMVQVGFPSAITGNTEPAAMPSDQFGNIRGWRAPLANWLASGDNPLTARVMANRIWQHHFAAGIVSTPSDFGRNGAKPTHPELLDFLAIKFVESKWSVKAMHRLIMTSAAYRQSSSLSTKKAEDTDLANTLLWRQNRWRLEGESLRDSVLAVSGRLNPERGGPGVFPQLPSAMKDRMSIKNLPSWEPSDGPETRKRSVYIYQRRQLEVPFLSLMDASVFQISCERRAVSTTALQALTLMNGDLTTVEARHFASRVERETGPDRGEQIRYAFALALARQPNPRELKKAQEYLSGNQQELSGLCRILLNTNEFIHVD
ncbi:MAG: PSD1 and planctomycete cytochrome C domain-containing protein [Bryobacteraceae bacterium]